MTVRRVKNIFQHQNHAAYNRRHKHNVSSSYFKAALTALLLAVVILLLGLTMIDYEAGSYFDQKPMINIVIPPQDAM